MVSAPVLDKSDPRVENLYPFHLPFSDDWSEKKELFGSGVTMAAGGGMFMRNPLIIWISAVLGVQSYVTQEPLRAPKDASSPLATLGMALSGVIATTLPKMMLGTTPEAAATAATAAATAAT